MFNPAQLVFIDETSANTKMVRLSGRCPRGERLMGHVPHGHWKTITFVAALRRTAGAAPALDGSMNGRKFLAYIKQCLAPTLKRNDIVMIDNLAAHKAAGIREAIESARCDASLSAQIFAGFEADRDALQQTEGGLRKAAERTIPRLRRRIGRFAATLTAREACNYFRHAGYG